MRVNNGVVMRDAAIAGLGVALLPSFMIYEALAAKALQIIDIGVETDNATIFIAYPSDRRASAKVLAMIGHLRAAFGSPPHWDRPRWRFPAAAARLTSSLCRSTIAQWRVRANASKSRPIFFCGPIRSASFPMAESAEGRDLFLG